MSTKNTTTTTENQTADYVKQLIQKLVTGGLAVEKDFGELLEIKGWVTTGVTFTQMWTDDFKGTTVGRMLLPVFYGTIIDLMLKDETAVEKIADALTGYTVESVRWIENQLADNVPANLVSRTKPKKATTNDNPVEDPNDGVPTSFLNGKRRAELVELAERLGWTLRKTVEKALDDYIDKMTAIFEDIDDDEAQSA